MRNRPVVLSVILALMLAASATALLSVRTGGRSDRAIEQWRITLLEDGKPTRYCTQPEIPRDPAALFPAATAGVAVAYRFERITVAVSTNDAGWFSPSHYSAEDLRTIEFLLLLPPATLLVCFFRNVIGMTSFGTFAPALLGLAFREVHSPIGVFVVLTVIAAGWWLRRGLNELHLLQVPRTALLLSCVVIMLLILLSATASSGQRAITLFPLVILTGMIERFWAMEEEEGTANSIGTLATTLLMAACIWLLAIIPAVPAWMLAHPETLGYVMAAQLLLGRYTGFRIVELYRFRRLASNELSTA